MSATCRKCGICGANSGAVGANSRAIGTVQKVRDLRGGTDKRGHTITFQGGRKGHSPNPSPTCATL
eukprot:211069-Prorocentrum_minimum.AAC.2